MTADDPKTSDPAGAVPGGRSGESQGETPEEAIERLNVELAEKTAEAARNLDLYMRERAEMENFKKRMQRDKNEALRFAVEPLARDLLPVVDDLERAVEHAAAGGNGQPLLEGVRLVLRNALDVLERHGVTRVEADSGPFDPNRHEAVMQVPDAQRQPNQIVEQFEPGYTLHERLIRPAKVSVSTKPTVEDQQDDD
jgi:molecular chaperone GrpE